MLANSFLDVLVFMKQPSTFLNFPFLDISKIFNLSEFELRSFFKSQSKTLDVSLYHLKLSVH